MLNKLLKKMRWMDEYDRLDVGEIAFDIAVIFFFVVIGGTLLKTQGVI